MKKLDGKNFIGIILSIAVAITLMGYTSAHAGWEQDWQNAIKAGQKEGKVSVYVSLMSPAVRKSAPDFKKKFGIEVQVTAGRGSQIRQKLRREKAAGLDLSDVIISGGNTMFSVKKMGVTGPFDHMLILPEVTDPKVWYLKDKLPWTDDGKHLFHIYAYPNRDIAVNDDIIKKGEITSWQDLLKPEYKGKITWSDPTIAGSGFNGFCTNLMNNVTDEAFYRKLVATQEVVFSRNLRQMAEWLARGKYAIAVSTEGRPIAEMLKAGAHISYVKVKEGTYLSYDAGNVAVAAKAPHPNAAKVFVNWLLSKEGQIMSQNATKYMSSRVDIPTDSVNPKSMREPGERYFVAANGQEKWIYEEQEKYLALAKKIFGAAVGR